MIDSSDEMKIDGPSCPPSENAMTNGSAASERIESAKENGSESENDKEGCNCIMISIKDAVSEEEFLGFSRYLVKMRTKAEGWFMLRTHRRAQFWGDSAQG